MMDLCVFSISFMHLSYVSECVLTWAHVCLFADLMMFVVLSSPDDGLVVFQFLIHAGFRALVIRKQACACTSRCVYVCCINNKFVLFHLALMMELCVFSIFYTSMPSCTSHTWGRVCLHEQMFVCLLSQSPVCAVQSNPDDGFVCFFNFSYMHAFVHSSYVSEGVLARARVCLFAEWMMFVVLSSPEDEFCGFSIFNTCMPSCIRHTWASVCLHEQMCVGLLYQ